MGARDAPPDLGVPESEKKLWIVEASSWLWGTVQGAWNEKQTVSQIIVDAVIGMIPLVGDVTAVRDILAVGIGLATNPAKRDDKLQWVLFVILLFALIPFIGGVIKGVGRLLLRVGQNAADNAQIAKTIIEFLNRVGTKNAEAWLKALSFARYEGELLNQFRKLCDTVIQAIERTRIRLGKALPQVLLDRMAAVAVGFRQLRDKGAEMIPQAVKDLDAKLREVQRYVHSGGETTARATVYQAQTGQKVITYAEEARIVESGVAKNVVHAGKYPQNIANIEDKVAVRSVYKHEPGFPDLLRSIDTDKVTGIKYYRGIAAASGKIKNEVLGNEGAVTVFRAFGPARTTHGARVPETFPTGFWWGIGPAPKSADEWRKFSAVLDEFNSNGWLASIHIPKGAKVPACTSTASEQYGKQIVGQYLEGGGKQAAIDVGMRPDIKAALEALQVAGGGSRTMSDGIVVEIRATGWTNANGQFGYGQTVIPYATVTERLADREFERKVADQAARAVGKDQRARPER